MRTFWSLVPTGHSRLGEWIFGGAARAGSATQARSACLMSH